MTIAAVYARFSSDSQREESIEIQLERCGQLIEREKWVQGEIYTDYAMTGTNDKRPAFQRCIADGEAGLYDVLVVYKLDRFARNVEVSRRYKRKLRSAGVRIVSVREGESKDTPDGFLHEAMDEAFAEYYSRNLSVLIRDGIAKNAENCKASGVRIFGYDVDDDDRFVINEDEAAIVRRLFRAYIGGETVNRLTDWLKAHGHKTRRGNWWSKNSVTKLLKNDAYMGTYRYAGVEVPDGMPAIVDKGDFLMVQEIMRHRNLRKRASLADDYLLTEKLRCLRCGRSVSGTSGKGKSGKKYRYYACQSKTGNCGLRIPADKVEDAVLEAVKDMLADEDTVEAMVGSVMDYAASRPNMADHYREELAEVTRRRDKLVASIAEGIDPSAVKDAVNGCVERMKDLDKLIAKEEFEHSSLLDEGQVREYLARFVDKADGDPERAELLVSTFVDLVYADEKKAVVLFILDGAEEVPFEEIQALANHEHPLNRSSEGVRASILWWSRVTLARNLYRHNQAFALIVLLPKRQ